VRLIGTGSNYRVRKINSVAQEPLIAIVEDEASLRVALVGLLRSHGYKAEVFASAEAFLESDAAPRTSCVITDIQMPGLSGIDLKQRLGERGCGAPVIMITARTDQRLHQRAAASGALCVLRKPFAADDLIACIKRALAVDMRRSIASP
jgi:FixJ family two-component response regulator